MSITASETPLRHQSKGQILLGALEPSQLMTQMGRLPAYRFNERLTRYRRDDIAKWIESAKFHPQAA